MKPTDEIDNEINEFRNKALKKKLIEERIHERIYESGVTDPKEQDRMFDKIYTFSSMKPIELLALEDDEFKSMLERFRKPAPIVKVPWWKRWFT